MGAPGRAPVRYFEVTPDSSCSGRLTAPRARSRVALARQRLTRASRAPALYFVGSAAARPDVVSSFRLPCPPRLDAGQLGASAAERRIRKAYFATLDALRTGLVDPTRLAKLGRLASEVRSATTRGGVEHLRVVQRFVRRAASGWPVILAPEVPFDRVVVTAPFDPEARPDDVELERRYAWVLDWLRMHRWVAGRDVAIEWRPLATRPPEG